LFGLFPAPLLRAQFNRKGKGRWHLQSIRPIPASELTESHRSVVVDAAAEMFSRRQWTGPRPRSSRYDMAILIDPDEGHPPSTDVTLNKLMRVAAKREMACYLITREEIAQLVEYDALFIRTTTAVNHYTYRFARRAEAEGLAVIDDSTSIARCTNKVYLAERMTLGKVRIPRTVIVHRDNMDTVVHELGLPVVLKQPDSSFSVGVTKAHDEDEYHRMVRELLGRSEMIVAQEFLPTDYDWRVGVLDGEPLYACKYFMAPRHWQILNHAGGRTTEGEAETFEVKDAPRNVIRTAVKAARMIGDGLYGVDLKQVGRHVYVIEVNDNPNIDTGYEDKVLKDGLYERLVDSFIRRIERIREGAPRRGR
jgi:glutathione synthase/RimK-type ligase-like ATP-grasp enzyme